jgi:hypothetical protein
VNGFGEIRALPRWAELPGDPPALRQWLAGQRPARAGQDDDPPDDWPTDEAR